VFLHGFLCRYDATRAHHNRLPALSLPQENKPVPETWWRAWLRAILVYRKPRMAAALALGFSCGLPFIFLSQTMTAWLRQAGIERTAIGMLTWVTLVYAIKFLWAPVVDRLQLPLLFRLLGRRRSWMLLAQGGIVLGMINLSQLSPEDSLSAVGWGAFMLAIAAATQDIAVDAWRVEVSPPQEQGAMAAAYQLGYRTAIIAGTAGAFWVAAEHDWHLSLTFMASMAGVGILATLLAREPQPTTARESLDQEQRVIQWLAARPNWPRWLRSLGTQFIGAVVCPLTDFFARNGLRTGALIFAFICTYRLTDYAGGVMANPFYIDHGYTLKQVATVVKFFGLFATLFGVVLGGIIVARFGLLRALLIGSLLIMCSNIGYSVLASIPVNVVALGCINALDNIAIAVHGTSLLAFLASLTSSRYTATQYAVLSSIYALPGKMLMGGSGWVVDQIDYQRFFLYTAALSIPGLLLLYFVARARSQSGATAAAT
jgi:MFS transporter, PAT family, beta-lactamase induction signal transducer AmpG